MRFIHFAPALLILLATVVTAHLTKEEVNYQELKSEPVSISPFRNKKTANGKPIKDNAQQAEVKGPGSKVKKIMGKKIPEFNLKTLEGEEIDDKELYGKMVNIWASWCVGCKQEHHLLVAMKDEGYQIYGINTVDKEGKGQSFLDEMGNPFAKTVYDPKRSFTRGLGTNGIPLTLIVDKEGIIQYYHSGALSKNAIERKIKPMLEQM